MIPYIDNLMHQWARWVKVRRDGGLGYSPKAAGFAEYVGGGKGDIVGLDEQSWEIEQIVTKIRLNTPEKYKVIEWYYLAGNITVDRMAKELGCARDTVYSRLHAIHADVMYQMQENDLRD